VQYPDQQATVEVACALEGLAYCLQVSTADGAAAAQMAAAGDADAQDVAEEERERQHRYSRAARIAVAFLLEAQVGGVERGAGAAVCSG